METVDDIADDDDDDVAVAVAAVADSVVATVDNIAAAAYCVKYLNAHS